MYCFDWAVLFGCDDNDKLIKSKLGAEADVTYKKLLFFRYRVQCRPEQMLHFHITDHSLQESQIIEGKPECVDFLSKYLPHLHSVL